MKNTVLIIFSLFVIHLSSAQQYLKDEEEMKKHADEVINYMGQLKFHEAFIALKGYWPLPENEIDQLEMSTIKQFNIVADRFGEITSVDFVKDTRAGNFLFKKTYILRFQRHLIKIYFIYYNNSEGWQLNSFQWNDEIDDLFDE